MKIPGAMGKLRPGPQQHTVHSPWVLCTSQQAHWHLIVQEAPGVLGTPCHVITVESGIHASHPTESSRHGEMASCPPLSPASAPLSAASSQLLSLLHLTSNLPPKETVSQVGWSPLREEHHSRAVLYQATAVVTDWSSFGHRTRCGFFPQQRPMAVASASEPQILSNTAPQRASGAQYCARPGTPSIIKM